MITILIADDHEIFIEALSSLLSDSGEITVVATGSNGEEAVRLVEEHPGVDVLVLDVSMPVMDGIDALAEIRRRRIAIPTLMLTQEFAGGTIARAMKNGASGYVLKTAGRDEFLTAIRTVAGGGQHISESAKDSLIAQLSGRKSAGTPPTLTKRELEVLKLVAAGMTTAQIATALFISTYTAETHRRNILQKLGLKNAAGLVRYAIENGLADE
jgi:DNA-binding NarL/FixJ family response regulator